MPARFSFSSQQKKMFPAKYVVWNSFSEEQLRRILLYRWKGNSTASRIHFKYWKNILISRIYEQFSRNDFAMVPEWLAEKLSDLSNINISYMTLKHVNWRFRICNYFRDFINTLRNFAKYILLIFPQNLHISRNNLY